jgi:hypothetical protein
MGGAANVESAIPFIDDHNRFILNGEPFFPLGLYVAQCSTVDESAQLNEIQDSPFDTLMNYAINTCGDTDATHADIDNDLAQLQSRNLKLIFSLVTVKGLMDIVTITDKVNTFRGHPAVIGWYMNDERGPEFLPELQIRYQMVKGIDASHPVWSVHWNTDWLLQEADTTDIVGVDPYPIDNNPITLVSQMADAANKAGKPLWLVPQIFDWRDYPGDFREKTGRPPTRDEMRAMTYLAINHGAKGLIYYSYFNIRDDKDYKARWEQIKKVGREIKDLRPVILSTHKTDKNDIICSKSITDVSLKIKLVRTPRTIRVLFEDNREIRVRDGDFTDSFGPYGVHVYQWKAASP